MRRGMRAALYSTHKRPRPRRLPARVRCPYGSSTPARALARRGTRRRSSSRLVVRECHVRGICRPSTRRGRMRRRAATRGLPRRAGRPASTPRTRCRPRPARCPSRDVSRAATRRYTRASVSRLPSAC